MLDIRIRVITFAANLPACQTALRYFMRSWKLNAGEYFDRTRFTIMLPQDPDEGCLATCKDLAACYALDLQQYSPGTAAAYGQYWPLSFLELSFEEDVVIYCPPHTLVAASLGGIIEKTHLEGTVLAGTCQPDVRQDSGVATAPLQPMWFASFPKSSRAQLGGAFPLALSATMATAPDKPTFHDVESIMARTFTAVLDNNVMHQPLAREKLCELNDDRLNSAHLDFYPEPVLFFALTDAPENTRKWMNVFSDVRSVRAFLDSCDLAGAWLYYQRTLRCIHASLDSSPFFQKRTIFKAKNSPYYIFALDYIQQSAGIRALHYLCHALNESGQEAYVTCEGTVPHLRTPVLTEATMMQHHAVGREPIMLYPEIVSGNPFGAKIVARWLLNKPGHIAGDSTFADDEIIFTFDPLYLKNGLHAETLHIPTSDLSLFNNDDNPNDEARDTVCYYAHKYLAQGGKLSDHVRDATSLGKELKLSHAEIAAILRRSKLLYVYEPTALVAEALLCGCPVVIVVTDYWRNNVVNHTYPTDWGVVMDDSPESVALAKANVSNYRGFYEDVVLRNAWQQIDRFIDLTQKKAKSLRK